MKDPQLCFGRCEVLEWQLDESLALIGALQSCCVILSRGLDSNWMRLIGSEKLKESMG